METCSCRLGCFKLTDEERNDEALFVDINGILGL